MGYCPCGAFVTTVTPRFQLFSFAHLKVDLPMQFTANACDGTWRILPARLFFIFERVVFMIPVVSPRGEGFSVESLKAEDWQPILWKGCSFLKLFYCENEECQIVYKQTILQPSVKYLMELLGEGDDNSPTIASDGWWGRAVEMPAELSAVQSKPVPLCTCFFAMGHLS